MDTMCIISFGNSSKYRLILDKNPDQIKDIEECVKKYLSEKYPMLNALNFYDRITVKEVRPEDNAQYAGYPLFDEKACEQIKQVLSREVENEEDVRHLNSNDKFGTDVNPGSSPS